MDNKTIGAFICKCRKSKNLTQAQLAQKLEVSEKTISKWECGNGMPDVSLMLPLCKILEINCNELLCGKRLEEDEYKQNAENNLTTLLKQNKENKKKIWIAVAVVLVTMLSAFALIAVASYLEISVVLRIVLLVLAFVVLGTGIAIACVLDRDAGVFVCPNCHHKFTPTMSAYVAGPHTITKRKLKCPNCGKISYCKHKITK